MISCAKNIFLRICQSWDNQKDDVVYDLYCGIGSISLLLAKRAKYVYGIEVVPQSIISAKENAEENNIDNIEFICGKVENEIKKLTKKAKSPDIIVLDPARKGCDPSSTCLVEILSCGAGAA